MRLLHVESRVEHEYVLMDDEKVVRKVVDPVVRVTAEEWPAYSGVTFPALLAATQAKLGER